MSFRSGAPLCRTQQNRRLDLSELCNAFALDANVLRKEIPSRLNPALGGEFSPLSLPNFLPNPKVSGPSFSRRLAVELQGQMLITRSFRSTLLAAARGGLRGSSAPLVVSSLAQTLAYVWPSGKTSTRRRRFAKGAEGLAGCACAAARADCRWRVFWQRRRNS